jgi:rhodanese-related sulfurtransferase
VKVFAEGLPAWVEAGLPVAVGIEHVHAMIAAGKPYMLIDSRPANRFLEGAIPTAISIPDSQFEARAGMLPSDKNLPLIFYCSGYDCPLSHMSAEKAKGLGYTNIMVAEAGYPAWTKLYGTSGAVAIKGGETKGAIDKAQLEQILRERPESIHLIDVRSPEEYAVCHLPGAVNIPVRMVGKKMAELPSDKPIVFVCSTGTRSGKIFSMVQDMRPELKEVYYLEANVTCSRDGSFTIAPGK